MDGTTEMRLCRVCKINEPFNVLKHGYICSGCKRAKVSQWKKDNPERHAATNAAWKERNPDKVKAHAIVQMALIAGQLVKKPCEDCGAEPTNAHHEDYGRPLDVNWLCDSCHVKRHKK